jgi:hypothetical protein
MGEGRKKEKRGKKGAYHLHSHKTIFFVMTARFFKIVVL